MHEPELQSHERQWLFELCDTDVPDDFADRVVDATLPVDELEDGHTARATPSLEQRRRRAVVTGAVALAAVLVLSLAALLVGRTQSRAQRGPAAMQATESLQRECGDCHDARRDGAAPGALEAFDLSDPAWVDGLTDASLRALADRVDARDDIDPADRNRIQSFVQAELDARQG